MAVTMQFSDLFMTNVGNGNVNLATHTFKAILVNGYTFNAAHDELADVSASQIANGNGYTTGGKALQNITWAWDGANSRTKWDSDDLSWTASGGAIGPATGCWIYSDTSTGDKLVCYIDFGGAETAGDGTDFKITFNANGIFVVTQ